MFPTESSNLSVQKNTTFPSKPGEIDTKDAKKATFYLNLKTLKNTMQLSAF